MSSEKKYRKKRRIKAILHEYGIEVCDEPRKCVLVGNSGLLTGDSMESILCRFPIDYAPLDIVMVPGRQFCWLVFESVEIAQRAVSSVDGVSGSPTLYLFYVRDDQMKLGMAGAEQQNSGLEFGCPPGAKLIPDFVTSSEEESILNQLNWNDADNSAVSLKQRQVLHFGHVFNYATNNIDHSCSSCASPMPQWSRPIVERLLATHILPYPPDQLTVNKYRPGDGIPSHCDTHSAFDDNLVSVSLSSSCVMQFISGDGQRRLCLELPQRSALLLSGESRYGWRHAIAARRTDVVRQHCRTKDTTKSRLTLLARCTRVSLTFRKLRPPQFVCKCTFATLCDSRQSVPPCDQPAVTSKWQKCDGGFPDGDTQLELRHVVDVYERIATHFSSTRHTAWPRVAEFIRNASDDPHVRVWLDVGCGNGKYLKVAADSGAGRWFAVGVDRCAALCALSAERGHQAMLADCVRLPVRDACIDRLICVAVLHHLASRRRRRAAIAEMARVMRSGARGLIYVWARQQHKAGVASTYVSRRTGQSTQQQHRPNSSQSSHVESSEYASNGALALPVHASRTEFQQQDVFVPWKIGSGNGGGRTAESTLLRYYHVYEAGELEQDVQAASTLAIIDSYYDQGNWCVIFEKTLSKS